MKVTWGAASPFRTNTATVILLLSVPFVVMSWLLTSAILKHEHQFSEAKQVLAFFRSGLAAIDSLEEMRGLSRPANRLFPQPEVSARYDAAQKQAQQRMQQFFALTHQFARQKPSVSEPLQRLEEALPRLEDAGSGAGCSLLGPLDFISHFMDETYGILANVLYASTFPEGEKSRSAEMLLIIPDTLRRVHHELGIMTSITFPTTMNPNGLSAADITYLAEAIGNLGMLLDTLGHQLQAIKQHSGVGAANPAKLDEVRGYQDRVEKDVVLTHVQWDWERAYTQGLRGSWAGVRNLKDQGTKLKHPSERSFFHIKLEGRHETCETRRINSTSATHFTGQWFCIPATGGERNREQSRTTSSGRALLRIGVDCIRLYQD